VPGALTATVTAKTRSVRPGEAVLIEVRTSAPADTVSGSTPSGPLHFARGADPLVWEALTGLDLSVKPGPWRIAVRAESGRAAAEAVETLQVHARTFPSRRITVDPRFATPPASERPRIEREAKQLAAILAAVTPARSWRLPFGVPVPGRATSAFGRVSIVNGIRQNPHTGTDFSAAAGTPVRAPAAGTVVLSDNLYFAGDAVVIDHGLGVYSLMAHLSERRTKPGDAVAAGDVVGLSGATGRVMGPHLHWSVRIGDARIDPESLLSVLRPPATGSPARR
jgi:murein DD-endopeptidase MepM/ murein hydrolase activator NlpD